MNFIVIAVLDLWLRTRLSKNILYTALPVISSTRYLLIAVHSKFNRTCPRVLNYVKYMARSVRSRERVNQVALNNLSLPDFEPVSSGKENINPRQNYVKWRDLSASGNHRKRRHELIILSQSQVILQSDWLICRGK